MKFNINDIVKVRLTSLGEKVYTRYLDRCSINSPRPFIPEVSDSEGYITFQLWQVMYIFGEYFRLGCDIPIETEIILENVE